MTVAQRQIARPARPWPAIGPLLRSIDDRCEALLARPDVWLLALCCAALVQAALIVTHRAWLDEWQALLIARDTPSLASMFQQLHYEGHPQLWYLVLRGVGSVVPSAWVFAATNLALAAISCWAILARAPFRRLERLLLVFNEIVLFEMLTVSRSLTLGVALLFLALALWRTRLAWLAIALLPLCDFFFGAIACVLIAVRLRDRQDGRSVFPGLALFGACALVAAWGAFPAQGVITDPARGWILGPIEFSRELGTLVFPWEVGSYDNPAPLVLGLLLAPAFLTVCMHALRKDRLARLLLYGFLALLLLFACSIYPIYLRHTALAGVLLIALVWIGALKGVRAGLAFRMWLWSAAVCGLATAAANLLVPFDTAARAASSIHRQKLERKLWYSYPSFRSIALGGETGIRFGNVEEDCAVGFMRWNVRAQIRTRAELEAALKAAEARHGSFYLATDVLLPPNIARPIATVPAGYDGVQYNLWKIGDGPVRDADLPSCVPGLAR